MKRSSPIAGSWYKGTKHSLEKQIRGLFTDPTFGPGSLPNSSDQSLRKDLLGIIVPHAGYIYSGPIAAHSYKVLKESMPELDTAIILGPNHRGFTPPVSVYPKGSWSFPLGDLTVDTDLVQYLQDQNHESLQFEESAHQIEHSIDIQMPFLLYLYSSNVKILPICIADQSIDTAEIISDLLHNLFNSFPEKKMVIIASSDLSHENDYSRLEKNDAEVVNLILNGDPRKLDKFRKENHVTMCGYCPVYVLMSLANKLTNTKIEFLKYSNSRLITGSSSGYTVGYPSFCFSED